MIMDLSCSKYSGSRRRRREGKKRNSIRSSKDRRIDMETARGRATYAEVEESEADLERFASSDSPMILSVLRFMI
jgi:hypothetical protein